MKTFKQYLRAIFSLSLSVSINSLLLQFLDFAQI